MVDLLERHHREGGRFEPTEFVEEGPSVAVGMKLSNTVMHGETPSNVFKVFTFGADGRAVLLQDSVDRGDALAHLESARP